MKKHILAITLLIIGLNSYAQLSGTYSIGGASPDYPTISLAIQDLNTNGVSGPTVFNIRSGSYNEQVSVNNVPGTSAINTILFQGETPGDSTLVNVNYTVTGSGVNNYVWRFQDARFVSLQNLTVESLAGSSYGTCVMLDGYNYSLSMDHCAFIGQTTTSASDNRNLIQMTQNTNADTSVYVRNCLFENGSNGLDLRGYYTWGRSLHDVIVTDNQFVNQYLSALKVEVASNVLIERNTASSTNVRTYNNYAFDVNSNVGTIHVRCNRLNVPHPIGLRMEDCYALPGQGEVINNMISVGGGSYNVTGFQLRSPANLRVESNTIRAASSYSNSYAMNIYSYTSIGGWDQNTLLNNMFYFDGSTGATLLRNDNAGIFSSHDHNNLYSPVAIDYLVSWGGAYYTDLIGFNQQEPNSISRDPSFISSADLHVTSANVGNQGVANGVLTDIDGELRDLASPDMGADEFTPDPDNIAGSIVSPISGDCVLTDSVWANFYNWGGNAVSSATFNWTVNGVAQTPVNWTGAVAPDSGSGNVFIGLYSFVNGDALVVSADMPNGVTDTYPADNAGSIPNLYAGLAPGSYTVEGSSPDFTFQELSDQLNYGGVCGPVTFNIRDGIYLNQQLAFGDIIGTSSVNTVTIQSENLDSSLVILTFQANSSNEDYVLRLTNTRHFTISHVSLISDDNGGYGKVVELLGYGLENLSILNCEFVGANDNRDIIEADGSGLHFSSFRIENNALIGGENAITIRGNNYNPSTGLIIRNNQCTDQDETGMQIEACYYPVIEDNRILGGITSNVDYGFYLEDIEGGCSLQRNIVNIQNTNVYSALEMDYCVGQSTSFYNIVNNSFTLRGDSQNGVEAIYLYETSYANFHNNSINVYGDTNGTGIYLEYSYYINMQNNNVSVNGGYALEVYEEYAGPFSITDYNNFYTTGPTLIRYYHYALGQNVDYSNLTDYQLTLAVDANSFSVVPNYTSNTDLHILCQDTLNNAGSSLPSVLTDLDNMPRSVMPDIGAYEFDLPGEIDLGPDVIICAGDSVVLEAGPGMLTSQTWSTGSTDPTIPATSAGTYSVAGVSACISMSDSVVVSVEASPFASGTFTTSFLTSSFTNTSSAGTVSWDFGDGDSSGSNDPVHVYAAAGSYNVTLTVNGTCGIDDTTFNVVVTAVGIHETQMEKLSIYPNPSQGLIHVNVAKISHDFVIDIYSTDGKLIKSVNHSNSGIELATIDLSNESAGTYLVRITSEEEVATGLVIIE